MRTFGWLALLGAISLGCAARPKDALRPIPDLRASGADGVRGTASAAAAVSDGEQVAIIREIVRAFYRPTGGQARWIDPQPLAHRRSLEADSSSVPDDDWALAIVQAVGLGRVCVLDESDHECRGRPGGVLRFSRVYSAGSDTGRVFARYEPVRRDSRMGPAHEMEFHIVPDRGGWRIATKRSVAAPE